MEFAITMTLGILGAALVAGGFVAYRGSQRTGTRAFGAAAVAAGVVMCAIVLLTTQVSVTEEVGPAPAIEFGNTLESLQPAGEQPLPSPAGPGELAR